MLLARISEPQAGAQKFIPESVLVPSGVAEIAELQARGGYAYLKP